jgi:hypothetical protein
MDETAVESFRSSIPHCLLHFQAGSRQWLYDAIANWLESSSAGDHQQTSRVFWIQADPGVGKSSFAATLRKKLKDEQRLLGSFFYRYTEKNNSPAKALIKCLSSQCSQSLSGFTSWNQIFQNNFVELSQRRAEFAKLSSVDLFDLFLAEPLHEHSRSRAQDGPHPPLVILIDALDEVPRDQRKPLLYLLTSKIQSLPSWVKFVITSCPEADITDSLSQLPRLNKLHLLEIHKGDPRHLSDIRSFVSRKLAEDLLMNEDELEAGVDLLVARSGGSFLYVSKVIEEIQQSSLSGLTFADLDNRLPDGLIPWYRELFVGMRNRDEKYFEEVIFPVVRLIVGSRQPLSLREVKLFLNLDLSHPEELLFPESFSRLFPVHESVFVPVHKTLCDWLVGKDPNGLSDNGAKDRFHISKEESENLFVECFRSLFVPEWLDKGTTADRPASGSYFYRHCFDHFLDSSNDKTLLFGLDQLFRLRVLTSLLEEIGIYELVRVLERYLFSISFKLPPQPVTDTKHDISELKLLLQLMQLSSPGLQARDLDALPSQLLMRMTPSQRNGSFLRLRRLSKECNEWQAVGKRGYWFKPQSLRPFLITAGRVVDRVIQVKLVGTPLSSSQFSTTSLGTKMYLGVAQWPLCDRCGGAIAHSEL